MKSFHINHHYLISFSLHFTLKKTALHPNVEIFSDQLQPAVFGSAQLFLTVCHMHTTILKNDPHLFKLGNSMDQGPLT